MTPTDPPAGLRARKKQARADAIVDAAQRLVLDRGLDAVTVEGIAEAAGISPRTFFNYFDSKDDAVLGQRGLDVDDAAVATFVAGGPTGDFLDDVEALVTALVAAMAGGHDRAERAFGLMESEPRLLAGHVTWLEKHRTEIAALFARRAEHASGPADPDFCSMTVFLLVRATGERWERSGRTGELTDHVPGAVAALRALSRA
ncbi:MULTISPECIES: TetR/AcrR family transcriptional regulator [Isoptericola]|uniref:Helix-turn-helix domain-containing protein n=1 Tax=Isoptericola haloaureus TaxID=1542902 RepID=A0ABU7Z6F4_9MICO|nr:TetR/AcrR family transcriptional regulator [Isoptericola sp. AK164]